MQIKYIYIRIFTAIAIFVCYVIALLTFQNHVIFYQEQHHLFLFTADYFQRTLQYEGWPGYLGAFVIQFYHVPWLGACITALLLTAAYLLVESIIRRLTGLRDLLQLGAAASVALYFTLDGLDETPGRLVIADAALLVAWLIAVALRKHLPKGIRKPLSAAQAALPLILAAAYIAFGYLYEAKQFNFKERAMFRAERAIKDQNWDEALKITDNYLAYGFKNKLMLYLRNIALAQKGMLAEHAFDYPMTFGADGVFFPWASNSRDTEYGHLAHEITGNLNTAHRWAFEAMTVWGETGYNLTNLAKYNVAIGRPKVAQRFVNKLKHSLFYRHTARDLQRQIDGEIPPAAHYAYAKCPDAASRRFINNSYPANDLIAILNADPDNAMSRQYLTTLLLSTNDLDALVTTLPKSKPLPQIIEEALLIYSLDPQATPLQELGLSVSDATKNRYSRMLDLQRKGDTQTLAKEFGTTFWSYLINHSPYGPQKNSTLGNDAAAQGTTLNH